ncbi:MAG: glycosyltransferase family 4 protein [Muribaculaceae bacterium]|nr:glycosyltransferase family 4 protein [Muribaculaceae bacterium]
MNILYLTISEINDTDSRGIYNDLLRELARRGHNLYIATAAQRRTGERTRLIDGGPNCSILKVRILNVTKCNIFEKGVAMLTLARKYSAAISHAWPDVKFDLILYATPPITLNDVIVSEKKRTGARTYLMLKDIFPQNAVDLGYFSASSVFYRMFRRKEKRLYRISDRIGCMSPANVSYLLAHNPELAPAKVELCPNAVELTPRREITAAERASLLASIGVPADKVLSVYGGNLGRPQGVDFLLQTIESNERRADSFFLIVGSGTEYPRLNRWFQTRRPKNAALLQSLPKADFDRLLACADIGLIFLDPRFTIPNYPSRLLGCLECALPVIAATDPVCDMGDIAEANGFGMKCLSGDIEEFDRKIGQLIASPELRRSMGDNGRRFLEQNYTVDRVADIILETKNNTNITL